MPAPVLTFDDWSQRWSALARSAAIGPEEPLLLALSGGADSVLLLHWLAAARPAVDVRAAHVDHGLRGPESEGDARFAAEIIAPLNAAADREGARLENGRVRTPAGFKEAILNTVRAWGRPANMVVGPFRGAAEK